MADGEQLLLPQPPVVPPAQSDVAAPQVVPPGQPVVHLYLQYNLHNQQQYCD